MHLGCRTRHGTGAPMHELQGCVLQPSITSLKARSWPSIPRQFPPVRKCRSPVRRPILRGVRARCSGSRFRPPVQAPRTMHPADGSTGLSGPASADRETNDRGCCGIWSVRRTPSTALSATVMLRTPLSGRRPTSTPGPKFESPLSVAVPWDAASLKRDASRWRLCCSSSVQAG